MKSTLFRRFAPAGALAGVLLASGHLAAATLFLKFSDAKTGESNDKLFLAEDGWSELRNCSWSVSAETSWTKGGGASVGKPNPAAFHIERTLDSASAPMLKDLTTGKAAGTLEIAVRDTARGSSIADQTYLHYSFEGVFFTKISQNTNDGESPKETIEFVFKTITVGYRPTDPKTGKPGPEAVIHWDISSGAVTGP